MINIPIYSQRDSRWKDLKHGTSSTTIGQTGCVISCLAMVFKHFGFNSDPQSLNKLLTVGNGYANGNLVIWSKVAQLTGTKFIKRTSPYNNLDVWTSINIYKRPVLVEVLAPKGVPGGKHWVVFVGDKKAVDPWTGTIQPTSKYTLLGYAIYQK